MARIKDVAKEAGVAPSTVSLVLNKKGISLHPLLEIVFKGTNESSDFHL